MKALVIAVAVVLLATLLGLVLFSAGRDHRIDPFVDFRRVPVGQAAIDREVVEAELADHGAELMPALRDELERGSWRRNKLISSSLSKLPFNTRNWLAGKLIIPPAMAQDTRSYRAALTLGRLRKKAQPAIPQLQKTATSLQVWGSGWVIRYAQVALAMIQTDNAAVQSNALAALNSSLPPRKIPFVRYANEIWPDRPEVLDGPLHDRNESIRAEAVSALIAYGPRASNSAPILLEMLADPSPRVRPRAALALALAAPEYGKLALAVMLDQQRTNNAETGDYAHMLFQNLGPVASDAIPTLQAQLADPKMSPSHGDAAGALWRITGKASPGIINGLSTGLRSEIQRSQLRCLRILREIGPPAAAALPALNSYTNHPRLLIRQLAREAVRSITHNPGAADELKGNRG